MSILRLVLVVAFLVGGVALFRRIVPGSSKLIVRDGNSRFPIVSGYNLERQAFEFPRDFSGELNLVIIPFQQYQQRTVNTWIPTLQEIEASFPGFIYYELPTITGMPAVSRTFINEGMRAGIPDKTARERTITLYLNKEAFKTALDIPSEEEIYLFLVDRDGNILWRVTGAYSPEKANDLVDIIQHVRK
jgi:hypothetical protein